MFRRVGGMTRQRSYETRPQSLLTAIRITLNLSYCNLIIIITSDYPRNGCQLDPPTQLLLRILVENGGTVEVRLSRRMLFPHINEDGGTWLPHINEEVTRPVQIVQISK